MQSSLVIQRARASIVASLFLSKLTKLLPGLIILFASTQLGIHFWPTTSLVYGIRIDYLSPTIYFLDLLIILHIFLSGRSSKTVSVLKANIEPILAFLLVNLLYSQNSLSTLNWSLHFLIYLTFIFSLAKPTLLRLLGRYLPAIIFIQLIISIAQVGRGHSLGGGLYYLGERLLAIGAPGVALGHLAGEVVMRAYGTFSHPNTLSGWLVVSYYLYLRTAAKPWAQNLMTVVVGAAILLSQSRSAAISFFLIILPFFHLKKMSTRLIYFLLSGYLFLNFSFFSPARLDLANQERRDLMSVSTKIIEGHPVFGVGASASISTYPIISPTTRLLQPDHNSITLVLSWFGCIGLLSLFALFPWPLAPLILFVLPLAPLFLLDHYFFTSPQGLFILLVSVYVGVNYPHVQKNREQHHRPVSR